MFGGIAPTIIRQGIEFRYSQYTGKVTGIT